MTKNLKRIIFCNFLVVATLAVIILTARWLWSESSEVAEPKEEYQGQIQLDQPKPEQSIVEVLPIPPLPIESVQVDTDPTDSADKPDEAVENGQIHAYQPQPQHQPDMDLPGDPDEWRLVLVSPRHPLGYNFTPPRLETISDNHQVDSRIADSLRKMIASAAGDGIILIVTSAYRPAARQAVLHNQQIERFLSYGRNQEEAVAAASTIVLPPGTSEHQTGLAVDIVTPEHQALTEAFAHTPAGIWLAENAHRYGFILRYPRDSIHITGVIFEPWHFRYVGIEHASAIFEGGYTLEEYLSR